MKGIAVEFRDPYAVLRLDSRASAAEISRAYRAQLRMHHPDTRAGPDNEEHDLQERLQLQAVMDAYTVLGNAAARSAYDREHQESAHRTSVPVRRRHAVRVGKPDVVAGPLVWVPPRKRGAP